MTINDYENFLNKGNCGGRFCKDCKFVDCCDELMQLTLELSERLSQIGPDNSVKIEK